MVKLTDKELIVCVSCGIILISDAISCPICMNPNSNVRLPLGVVLQEPVVKPSDKLPKKRRQPAKFKSKGDAA